MIAYTGNKCSGNHHTKVGTLRPHTHSMPCIANLDFLGSSNDHSAIVFVSPTSLLGYQTSGPIITNGAALSGRIIIVSPEPVLELGRSTPLLLTIYGKAGASYSISSSTSLPSGHWLNPTNIPLTNNLGVLPLPVTGSATFYRAQQQ